MSNTTMNIYRVKLKTRAKMKKSIPPEKLGWWYDVCPGDRLMLRDATAEDLSRCSLNPGSSLEVADYLCELEANGSLVNKLAIEYSVTVVVPIPTPVNASHQPVIPVQGDNRTLSPVTWPHRRIIYSVDDASRGDKRFTADAEAALREHLDAQVWIRENCGGPFNDIPIIFYEKLHRLSANPFTASNGVTVEWFNGTSYEALNATTAPDTATAADYEEVLADNHRLVRELDVLLNGENAAQQASLCDIVGQVRSEGIKAGLPAVSFYRDTMISRTGSAAAAATAITWRRTVSTTA